jgi:hypothetical protein
VVRSGSTSLSWLPMVRPIPLIWGGERWAAGQSDAAYRVTRRPGVADLGAVPRDTRPGTADGLIRCFTDHLVDHLAVHAAPGTIASTRRAKDAGQRVQSPRAVDSLTTPVGVKLWPAGSA